MRKIFVSLLCVMLLPVVFPRTAAAQDCPAPFEIDLFIGAVPTHDWLQINEWGTLASLYGPKAEDVVDRTSPYVGLRFGYRVKRWFKVGADLGWSGNFYRQHTSDGSDLKESINAMTLIPKVTFFFATSRYVSAYAGVGFGVRYNLRQGEVRDLRDLRTVEPAWQITPIGITVGYRVPGFAELTFGKDVMGIKFGVGYRF